MKGLTVSKILILFLAMVYLNCAVGPQLSPMQKRQITTRLIDGSYEDTYRATMTVIQDQGYVIKNTDMQSGLIVANVDRSESAGSQFAQAFLFGYVANKGTNIEASFMINKINESKTEIRINIQEVTYGQSSAWSGTSNQNTKQTYDPEIYRNLFNQIEVEVKRRQAIAGNTITLSDEEKCESTVGENSNSELNQADMDNLFNIESELPVYINIVSIAKDKYLMVIQSEETPIKIHEKYKLVKLNDKTPIEIGIAKVIQIKQDKVALEYTLFNLDLKLTKEDKLKYK